MCPCYSMRSRTIPRNNCVSAAIQPAVNVTILMQHLIAIERAVGRETNKTTLNLILDAQECLLGLQREWLALPLKRQMEQKISETID